MIWFFVHPTLCWLMALTSLSALLIYGALKFRSGLAAMWAFNCAFPVLMFVYGLATHDRGDYVMFANDGPIGIQVHHWPFWQYLTGAWEDSNSIGYSGGGGLPNEFVALFALFFIVMLLFIGTLSELGVTVSVNKHFVRGAGAACIIVTGVLFVGVIVLILSYVR